MSAWRRILAQDALVIALEQWPESGVPENPGAWLMATAKHCAIDLLRRDTRLRQKHEQLAASSSSFKATRSKRGWMLRLKSRSATTFSV